MHRHPDPLSSSSDKFLGFDCRNHVNHVKNMKHRKVNIIQKTDIIIDQKSLLIHISTKNNLKKHVHGFKRCKVYGNCMKKTVTKVED